MKTIRLNDISEGLEQATLRKWYVKENDLLKKGENLLAFETAKAIMEAPAPFDGQVLTLHVKPGDIVQKDEPLITLA